MRGAWGRHTPSRPALVPEPCSMPPAESNSVPQPILILACQYCRVLLSCSAIDCCWTLVMPQSAGDATSAPPPEELCPHVLATPSCYSFRHDKSAPSSDFCQLCGAMNMEWWRRERMNPISTLNFMDLFQAGSLASGACIWAEARTPACDAAHPSG